MNDAVMFQGLARAMAPATPMAWPVTTWKTLFFDCPVEVGSHLQRFMSRQVQEQMELLGQLSREPNPSAFVTREAAFLQQSAVAWTSELMEVASMMQSRMLNVAQIEQPQDEPPYAHAA